jgi:hypothetical protein
VDSRRFLPETPQTGWNHIGFARREFIGFRGCPEYDKKRLIYSADNFFFVMS